MCDFWFGPGTYWPGWLDQEPALPLFFEWRTGELDNVGVWSRSEKCSASRCLRMNQKYAGLSVLANDGIFVSPGKIDPVKIIFAQHQKFVEGICHRHPSLVPDPRAGLL